VPLLNVYFCQTADSAKLSAEETYRRWLGERFAAATRQICALVHHSKPAVAQLALVTLMNLMLAQHRRNNSAAEGETV
jgi:hypothetical protein